MATACRICEVLSTPVGERAQHDQPIAATDYFEVVPSLGSLVPGWLLLIPKRHRLSLSASSQLEFNDIKCLLTRLASRLELAFGSFPLMFEHGATQAGSAVGCGVDHAHLHMVPFDRTIREAAMRLHEGLSWKQKRGQLDQVLDGTVTGSYIYLRDADGTQWLIEGDELPSQLMRRSIAHLLGKSGWWNWRDHPAVETSIETFERLRSSDWTAGDRLLEIG